MFPFQIYSLNALTDYSSTGSYKEERSRSSSESGWRNGSRRENVAVSACCAPTEAITSHRPVLYIIIS